MAPIEHLGCRFHHSRSEPSLGDERTQQISRQNAARSEWRRKRNEMSKEARSVPAKQTTTYMLRTDTYPSPPARSDARSRHGSSGDVGVSNVANRDARSIERKPTRLSSMSDFYYTRRCHAADIEWDSSLSLSGPFYCNQGTFRA